MNFIVGKQRVDEEKSFLIEKLLLINAEKMTDLKNQHFTSLIQ